jgi:hypothetical protein
MNDLIRAAAVRSVDTAQREPSAVPKPGRIVKPGSIGIGRGGTAAVRTKPAPSHALVNARLRRAARIVRDVQLGNGLTFDLGVDDPWGH